MTDDRYTLVLAQTSPPPGSHVPVTFQIRGPGGSPVTAYDERHDKAMHLVAARHDLAGYQHVHPSLDAAGTWTAPLDLTPGPWRVVADFVPAGARGLFRGADLVVPGAYLPRPLPPPAAAVEVDGYQVALRGTLVPGRIAELNLTIRRQGTPVTDLQPYLAAYGHLVVLREGDLAYLHVHPAGGPGDGVTRPGPDITFYATAPSAGAYRLFLDFRHRGVVRTAAFTALAAAPGRHDVLRPHAAEHAHAAHH